MSCANALRIKHLSLSVCLGWVIFAVERSMCQVLRVVISMEKQEHLEFWLYI